CATVGTPSYYYSGCFDYW
nr:immunoglobulin heavy chain junction region [Macaca mulatta]MOW75382.1 immunoglobulin heavy chain junction region [Macaca mulatta]MOW75402.1 immunoglobulin heavy chain junction region [Macaca mulatta]MOW75582.1 immunoglobulin heavy chain junction region [Macaca mulatta]MOW75682.1 immunoglobulin heavy chain junction region [Macaca mulatta]